MLSHQPGAAWDLIFMTNKTESKRTYTIAKQLANAEKFSIDKVNFARKDVFEGSSIFV